MYTISVLLPAAYLIGLIFTLKTHSHIYDIHISDGQGGHAHGQYTKEDTSTYHSTGELPTGHLPAPKSSVNATIIANSHIATGVFLGGVHVVLLQSFGWRNKTHGLSVACLINLFLHVSHRRNTVHADILKHEACECGRKMRNLILKYVKGEEKLPSAEKKVSLKL